MDAPPNKNIYVSLDGTDFPIEEPMPLNRKWFSHKFRGAGIRYEIGLNIYNGDIVHAYGGVPCGRYPDLVLARRLYVNLVEDDELTFADKGYNDDHFMSPKRYPQNSRQIKNVMVRHETVNHRIRQFGVLSHRFRHAPYLHPRCFHACVNMTQLLIDNGEKLYQIEM